VEELAGKLNAEERAQIVEALERMTRAIQELEKEPVGG
jgi:hypothetical protein